MKRTAIVLALLVSSAVGSAVASGAPPIEPVKLDKPLIAYWSFDESAGHVYRDASGQQIDASAEHTPASALVRTAGVFGNALEFNGRHLLRASEKLNLKAVQRITFSAWTQPARLTGYSEIFRKEDGEHRVLFSFQEGGRVLALGLNVNGYIECDARIDPAQLTDGWWHHCAATFDGRFMRVYVDGKEVGVMERAGAISAGGTAPGYIGSSNGGECFQGAMDDLRLYADALSPEQVMAIYRDGTTSLDRLRNELERNAGSIYVSEKTFAETVAATRRRIVEKGLQLDRRFTGALVGKLRADFPAECERFMKFTGIPLPAFLSGRDANAETQHATRSVELMLEYKPLTEAQWKRQTPEDRQKWEEVEKIAQRFEILKARGEAARFSPEWIELILEAGSRIDLRPHESEAVAPYMTPATPPTRDLAAAEAREALERDWLHQASGQPTQERIRNEIGWTRRLAERLAGQGEDRASFANESAALNDLDRQAQALSKPDDDLYFKVRRIKRSILFKNPVVDFDRVLFVDMPFPQGSEWPHETRHRLGYMAVPGGRLLALKGLRPDGQLTQLMPQSPLHGSFWRPDVSFDGKRVLFCFKPHNEKSFHLYEMNADGTGLVQLTDGQFDDLDPIYLPDGHILFSTTRGHTYVRCMPPTNAFVLARCDPDGCNIYLVSANNEPDYLPSVMNDGRVIYTRWEYTDKPLWRAQKLWTVNPDGTQVQMFWGNQSVWPDVTKDARSIPGSRRVMFTGCGHHDWFAGCVGIIDPDRGFNFPGGLTKVTADLAWPETGNGPVDPIESPNYHSSGQYPAHYSPYPLSEQDFLVSAKRGGKFLLYLMDVEGNRELIYEGINNIFHAMPLKARQRPPTITERVVWPSKGDREQPQDGVIFSSNVYEGASEELQGKVKFMRIMHIDPKTYTYWHKRPYISTGPVVSAVQSEGVKRVLGTVPVEADGSVAFYAPPSKALHFQLLDEKQRALQTMRSFVNVMPGEYRGCVGCHESHSRSPVAKSDVLALAQSPRRITPPPWGEDTVSYPRYVQPVLDRYCGECHQGNGEGRKALDLTERPSGPLFSEPYLTLIGRPSWGRPYVLPENCPPGFGIAGMLMVEGYSTTDPQAYVTPKPMTSLSYASKLIDLCSSGKHFDVRVDDVSLQRLIVWVDAMCPYKGDEEVRAEADPVFQGVDWLAIRPKVATAPSITRPGPVD